MTQESTPLPLPTASLADASVLQVAARVACTEAEGPGVRYAIWVQGCPLRCPGCCNPHMLDFVPAQPWTVEALVEDVLQTEGIEGITLLGGEPFAQAPALAKVAEAVQKAEKSVMIFSGYTLSTLRQKAQPGWLELLAQTDLLVDGPYIQAQHVTDRRWIGSANQQIHFLTKRYDHLKESPKGWDEGSNTIELRMRGGEIFINGFPHSDITQLLEQLAARQTANMSRQRASKSSSNSTQTHSSPTAGEGR